MICVLLGSVVCLGSGCICVVSLVGKLCCSVFSSVCVVLWCGLLNMCYIGLVLMILFCLIIVIVLYIVWIIFILCVISMIVSLRWWLMLVSSVRIDCVVFGLSVDVVLLYSSILGLCMSVCVMLICCFCLFDRFVGYVLCFVVSLMSLSSVLILCMCLVFGMLVIFSGSVMFLNIVFVDSRLKCWNIMLV